MPSGGQPTVPSPWSSRRRARAGARLGRAVALEDGDAHVLPGLLERRREERAGRQEQPERAAELRVDPPEQEAAQRASAGGGRSIEGARRAPSGPTSRPRARSRSRTGRGPAARRPSTSPDARAAHRRSPAGCGFARTGRSRRPTARRTARPPARAGATAAGATRSGAPSAGRSGGRSRFAASRLSWASITPFGVPVVPEVKISSTRSPGAGAARPSTCASQSVGRVVSPSGGRAEASTLVVGKPPRPNSAGSGASRPVPSDEVLRARASRRCRRSPPSTSAGRAGRSTSPARIAPKYVAGSSGRRWRPRQDPVAGLEAERRSRNAATLRAAAELAVGPAVGRAVLVADRERRSIAEFSPPRRRAGRGASPCVEPTPPSPASSSIEAYDAAPREVAHGRCRAAGAGYFMLH